LAKDLGRVNYFDEKQTRELLDFKTRLGFADARLQPGMENCDICANDVFRDSWKQHGIEQKAFEPPPPMVRKPAAAGSSNSAATPDQEALIQAITERVMAALNK